MKERLPNSKRSTKGDSSDVAEGGSTRVGHSRSQAEGFEKHQLAVFRWPLVVLRLELSC
jgi:hypothetical protein